MNTELVIFDLDGTLLNTLEDLTDSTNFILKYFNYSTRSIDEVRNFVGNGVAKLIERAIPYGLNNPNYKKCLELFKDNYKANMNNKTAPYSGIMEMLLELKKMGVKIAVVSNKFDEAVRNLCDKYFEDLIDFSAGENESGGIRKKPAPDTVLKVLEYFNVKKRNAIYVGDSEVDIQTAKNAGLECISVLWGFKNKEFLQNNGAKILISKPDEIFKYL
ncbi:HAD family hydrolase [bacterium]|nr:HAD family hydrolase [bacterium]